MHKRLAPSAQRYDPMRHGINKIKIQLGKDANKMLVRKLAVNFLKHGKITTTETKARVLKTHLEKLVEKTKKKNEANKNYLLKNLGDSRTVTSMFSTIGPSVEGRVGGYIKMQKTHQRLSDGSLMVKLEWSVPILIEDNKQKTEAVATKQPKEKVTNLKP